MTTVACRACGLPNPLWKHDCGDCERAGRRSRVTASPFNSATPHHRLGHCVTREIVAAGALLDLEVLDHFKIGRQCFVSLNERGLGFITCAVADVRDLAGASLLVVILAARWAHYGTLGGWSCSV